MKIKESKGPSMVTSAFNFGTMTDSRPLNAQERPLLVCYSSEEKGILDSVTKEHHNVTGHKPQQEIY